jgi:hypothetical protein
MVENPTALVPPDAPRSTEEKLQDPTWPDQLAAKRVKKEEELAGAAAEIAEYEALPMPAVSPETIAKQERFRQMMEDRRAEFEAMDPEVRARTYESVKREEFGE